MTIGLVCEVRSPQMPTNFDKYADCYREIINDSSKLSGEKYEFFIQLRIRLMKETVAAKLPKHPRILDFGCGIGVTALFLKEAFPGAIIWGVDSSPAAIAAAHRLELADVTFLLHETGALPFADDCFDLIYTNGTFHHISQERHSEIFRQLHRVLRRGGDLFIFENNPFNPLMMRAMAKNPFDKGVKALTTSYIKKALEISGFLASGVTYYFFFPKWLGFFRKAERYLHWLPLGAQYLVHTKKAS